MPLVQSASLKGIAWNVKFYNNFLKSSHAASKKKVYSVLKTYI